MAEDYSDAHHLYVQDLDVHDVNGTDGVKENGGITYYSAGDSQAQPVCGSAHAGQPCSPRGPQRHLCLVHALAVRSKWYPSLGVVIRRNIIDDAGATGLLPWPPTAP